MGIPAAQNVGAIVPYRMGAGRLPGKPLADIAGRAAFERAVECARACKYVDTVVVATTTDPGDDVLVERLGAAGIPHFRGSSVDVLRRLAEAATAYDMDVVVEVDGDDLLCAPEYMDLGVEILRERGLDALIFEGLPLGVTPKVLTTEALARAVREKKYEDTQTGFFRFIWESGLFQVADLPVADARHVFDEARMTLDYEEDVRFFSAVYEILDARGGRWDLDGVLDLLRERPDIVAINRDCDERFRAHWDAGLSDMRLDTKPGGREGEGA